MRFAEFPDADFVLPSACGSDIYGIMLYDSMFKVHCANKWNDVSNMEDAYLKPCDNLGIR